MDVPLCSIRPYIKSMKLNKKVIINMIVSNDKTYQNEAQ